MSSDEFRRLALAMDGAIEGAHMGHPDFRVNNRIFATLHTGNRFGMVALTPDQQRLCIGEHPDMFTPEAGAWGRAGNTRVELASGHTKVLEMALTLAWQNAIHKSRAKRRNRDRKERNG